MITVVHLVANVSKVNSGVWRAALVGAEYILSKSMRTILVSTTPINKEDREWIASLGVTNEICACSTFKELQVLLRSLNISGNNSVVVSHGAWQRPTRFACRLKSKGFRWVYVPQGMLEPWSVNQGAWKKRIYFQLVEGPNLQKVDAIRAVSKQEEVNLKRALKGRVCLIPNGIRKPVWDEKTDFPVTYLFMARLHHKKGITHLVNAWRRAMHESTSRLIIAGPDEGELKRIKPFLKGNVEYMGGVYGTDKQTLLQKSHYYILPSYSEGFPTSVLEAMSFGLIPVISRGCNFPEVFANNLGYQVEPDASSITKQLAYLKELPFDHSLSRRNHDFIATHYSEDVIGEKLFDLYTSVLREA